jgi:hypothetical protein
MSQAEDDTQVGFLGRELARYEDLVQKLASEWKYSVAEKLQEHDMCSWYFQLK